MEHRAVADVMTTEVVTAAPDTPFKELARLMADRRVSALPVVDGGRLVGVVTEGDLLCKEEFAEDTQPHLVERPGRRRARAKAGGVVAAEVMTSPAVSITPRANVVEAAKLMARRAVRRLPVLDEAGALVGIVSRGDLLRVFLRPDEQIHADVVREVVARRLWTDPATVRVRVRDGVVTLSGELELRSSTELAAALARSVDGVVAVHGQLGYRYDDRATAGAFGPTF